MAIEGVWAGGRRNGPHFSAVKLDIHRGVATRRARFRGGTVRVLRDEVFSPGQMPLILQEGRTERGASQSRLPRSGQIEADTGLRHVHAESGQSLGALIATAFSGHVVFLHPDWAG